MDLPKKMWLFSWLIKFKENHFVLDDIKKKTFITNYSFIFSCEKVFYVTKHDEGPTRFGYFKTKIRTKIRNKKLELRSKI